MDGRGTSDRRHYRDCRKSFWLEIKLNIHEEKSLLARRVLRLFQFILQNIMKVFQKTSQGHSNAFCQIVQFRSKINTESLHPSKDFCFL